MGCVQSKIDNEESVARCKERRQHMKDAVAARNAFAAAHSAYIVSLKNTGAALSEYGQAEMVGILHPNTSSSSSSTSVAPVSTTPVPIDTLPPPPPPLPEFSPSPLQRAASMPDLPYPKPPPRPRKNPNPDDSDAVIREEEEEAGEEGRGNSGGGGTVGNGKKKSQPSTPPPPPPPDNKGTEWDYFFDMGANIPVPTMVEDEIHPEPLQVEDVHFKKGSSASAADGTASAAAPIVEESPPVTPGTEKNVMDTPSAPPPSKHVRKPKSGPGSHHYHATSTGVLETRRGKTAAGEPVPPVNLVQILIDLDDHFLKASQSAQDVSKMLEATRLHYHSNFADSRGHIDHSERVMRVITWNKSFKGLPDNDNGKDDFDNDEWETHATILDKLLAWEKKLYEEVKAGELMKIEYQKKVALLNKQKKRRANAESLEKTKAAVSHLHTRYIVDIQSMDSTVSEIQHLRDDQLCPKLVALIDGMAQMWETMHAHHDSQLKMVIDLRGLDISSTPVETNQQHLRRTAQLYDIVSQWHEEFKKLVNHQKEYMQALNNWLKLNIIPIESSLKEKVSSPPRIHQPPIQAILRAWHDRLEKLPDDIAKSAIYSFAAIVKSIIDQQHEELAQKRKCDDTRKEYQRKNRAFTDWCQKNMNHTTQQEEGDGEQIDNAYKNAFAERQFSVESLKKRLEEEEEGYGLLCKQVREKSVANLRTHLPELFRAMSDFSLECSRMYKYLKSITQLQNNGHP